MRIENTQNISIFKLESTNNLFQLLEKIRNDNETKVLILDFIDEKDFSINSDSDKKILEQIKTFSIPVITIIRDLAKGFVFEIILASHLCIATELAEFEIGEIERIKIQIGAKNVEKLNFIETRINTEKAFDLGIINKIVPSKKIEKTAFEMAEMIASLAPIAIRSCIQAVNEGLEMDMESGLKLETELFTKIFATEDMKEGTRAFLEKRKANFTGK